MSGIRLIPAFQRVRGLSTAYHATPEGEKIAVSSDQLMEGEWNHLALVVNRLDGEVRHFLNGKLVGADEFHEGTYGDISLGDWYLGVFQD